MRFVACYLRFHWHYDRILRDRHPRPLRYPLPSAAACLASGAMIQIHAVESHRVESVPLPRTLALPRYIFAELAVRRRALVILNASARQKVKYEKY